MGIIILRGGVGAVGTGSDASCGASGACEKIVIGFIIVRTVFSSGVMDVLVGSGLRDSVVECPQSRELEVTLLLP